MIIHSEADFAFGIIVGFIIMVIVSNIIPTKEYEMVTKAIEECEQSIPRDQHCKIKIIAVVDEGKNK